MDFCFLSLIKDISLKNVWKKEITMFKKITTRIADIFQREKSQKLF